MVTIPGSAPSTPAPLAYLIVLPYPVPACETTKNGPMFQGLVGPIEHLVFSPGHGHFPVSATDSVNYTQSLCLSVETPLAMTMNDYDFLEWAVLTV